MAVMLLVLFSGFINLAGGSYSVLVSGDKANEGSVLFYNGTSWYGICRSGWDDQDAAVVCRMLGYTGDGASAITSSTASTNFSIWPLEFNCVGNELSLQDCPTSDTDAFCQDKVTMKVSCLSAPVPDNFFIIAFETSIARMDLTSTSLTLVQAGTLERAIAVTYDGINNQVIWTDITLDHIAQCDINGGGITVVYQAGSESVMEGIVIDESARMIFYTDSGYDEIGVINTDTFTRTVLINTNLDQPRAIVVDKNTREIFWTDWGTNAAIERANYDGSNRQVIVSTGLLWPNSLKLDGATLIWCDAGNGLYYKVFRNGTGRIIVTAINGHCFDFTTDGNTLYVNDWNYTKIVSIHKEDGSASQFGPSLAQRFGIFHHLKGSTDTVESSETPSTLSTGAVVGIVLTVIIGTTLIVNVSTILCLVLKTKTKVRPTVYEVDGRLR